MLILMLFSLMTVEVCSLCLSNIDYFLNNFLVPEEDILLLSSLDCDLARLLLLNRFELDVGFIRISLSVKLPVKRITFFVVLLT